MRLSLPSWRFVVFDLEELDLKIKPWLIVKQLEKFIEVIRCIEAYYINSDVAEKQLSKLASASWGPKMC